MKLDENNYVELAEEAIKRLKSQVNEKNRKPLPVVTTSKIRNLLAMTAEIYNEVQNDPNEHLSEDIKGRINYLKVRVVYEAGREDSVKRFVKTAAILEHLDEIKGSRKQYILFSRYMEALVAYRKFLVEDKDA